MTVKEYFGNFCEHFLQKLIGDNVGKCYDFLCTSVIDFKEPLTSFEI